MNQLTHFLALCGALFAGAVASLAATYHVAPTGNDTHPGTPTQPFRTVQRGVNAALAPGDVVVVAPGPYHENVVTRAAGTPGNPIVIRAAGGGESILRTFRFNNHPWVTLDGFTLTKAQNQLLAFVRIEAAAHNVVVRNCFIRDAAAIVRPDWRFDATDSSISAPGVNWAAQGFETGARIYAGAAGIDPHIYENHDRAFTITGISGDKAFVSPALYPETITSVWAPIFAGMGNPGTRGVMFVPSGGLSATNAQIVNNTFSNLFGASILLGIGPGGTLVQSNTITRNNSWAGIHPHGSNHRILDNLFIDHLGLVQWSRTEGAGLTHPAGTGWYDFIQGFIHTVYPGTNVVIARNWFENIQNPFGTFSRTAETANWRFQSNVVVGVQEHIGGGMNDMVHSHNTWYRVSYGESRTIAVTAGGSTSDPIRNFWLHHNAFIDTGSHANLNQERGYNLVHAVNSGGFSNWLASAETTGWQGASTFTEPTGFNGGNPLLRDPLNPRGLDGIPFTEDDGLRPLPGSPLALHGIGALPPVPVRVGQPIAHFSALPDVPGWHDVIGFAFDPAWTNLAPFQRTEPVRPWRTPEVLGTVPCTVHFDASHSVGALTSNSTNWTGITTFEWDFGDGSTWTNSFRRDGRTSPHVTHVFGKEGTFTVRLRVRNEAGTSATFTNRYRVRPALPDVRIHHVSPSGNDSTGDGSQQRPWRTLTAAYARADLSANTWIVAHPGSYPEWLVCHRTPAPGRRIHLVGLGATVGGFHLQQPRHTVRGWHLDGSNAKGAVVLLGQAASQTEILRNSVRFSHPLRSVFAFDAFGANPANHQQSCLIADNVIHFANLEAGEGLFSLQGRDHQVLDNVVHAARGQADFVRLHGDGHVVRNNYLANHGNGGTTDRVDFFHWSGHLGRWFTNILIEHNTVIGDPNPNLSGSICLLQQFDIGRGYFDTGAPNGNVIVRSNVFHQVHAADQSANGVQWLNNLFYRCARTTASVIAGGSTAHGTAHDTVIRGNLFFECGINPASDRQGWYALAPALSSLDADFNTVTGLLGASKRTAPPDDPSYWGSYGWERHGINGGSPLVGDPLAFNFRPMVRPAAPRNLRQIPD
ncbi:MAG: DUF1565 domain-containing protein [Verrucomicrobiae bacterium]|nr:DUF1565 domain-containing protein [Verrucomicrobiae bacterium]